MTTTRKKSWSEIRSAMRSTIGKWGVTSVVITPSEAPERRDRHHSPQQRKVECTFLLKGRKIVLRADRMEKAHDNLEFLALALETMRVMEMHALTRVLMNVFGQVYPQPPASPAPRQQVNESDPYLVLGVERRYPLAVIEKIWKARLMVEHPDVGGDGAMSIKLNMAMDAIRKDKS